MPWRRGWEALLKGIGSAPRWRLSDTWVDAITKAIDETGLETSPSTFPDSCPWPIDAILAPDSPQLTPSAQTPAWRVVASNADGRMIG